MRRDASPLAARQRLLGLLLVGACGGEVDPQLPPIVWTGQHVEVGTDLDLEQWCPGTLARLDSHVGALKDLFEAPGDHLVTYYLYPLPVSDHACAEGIRACYADGAVFTGDLPDTHELVHAVSAAHDKMPHFFEEGAASYWGFASPGDLRGLDIREVLEERWSSGMDRDDYALAGHFTSYLVHTYGLERYVVLMRGTSRGQPREDFEVVFEHALGLTLDDAIDDYEANWPYCDVRATRQWFHECSQPTVQLAPGSSTDFDLDISCADPEVVGPSAWVDRDAVPRIWRDITIELDSATQDISFDAPAVGEPNTVVVEVKRCDTRCGEVMRETWRMMPDSTDHPNYYNLGGSPGRYVVRVSRAADDPGPVRFRWRSGPAMK